ncbi:pullulanase-type alpha-1,6-glucosidase [Diaminobutyricimonas aerilata]|uniref:Pullulanase-type alpha-1,6-glucosidase n=1 Tax=Diaminobutyricimonas aerilata TaxID=1162967 RepID=A0A2M9CKZ7_9MICO|nr:pullulanase-type alpha-1,6-glucosidase [Diaminobutyricimonas aerilata]PJJ72560.1 pullulanase-type alpha-1,6-glucosidase [Diaminobutyricimonas aerilata]
MTPGSAAPRFSAVLAALALLATGLSVAQPAAAADENSTVALVGSLQSELGCAADWAPDCEQTELAPTATPGVWSAEFEVPAGTWEYKVALDDSWDEAYGLDGGDANIPLTVAGTTTLRFTFDLAKERVGLEALDLAGPYGEADAAIVAPPVRQPGSGEQFYFVMTDRFRDGDPANNTAGLGTDPLVSGYDPTRKGFYNGGDLAGLRSQLDYIEGLGTSAIWLTPSFKNRPVQGAGENASAGYHGYWITDFTQIDPHLGTNAELEALIDDAHARGIKVYFDIITNHTADVIDYAEKQYDYIDKATSPYTTAAGEPFDPADYAGGDDFPELDSSSFPYTPVIAPDDADLKVPGWLNDPTLYHNRGDSTFEGESVLDGDFAGLDDLMTEHPRVVDGFVDVYESWVDLGIDGFRIDTVKHVNREFWEEWSAEVLDHAHTIGNDDFFMFGEVYDADAAKLAPYVRDTDMNSVLDFAFQSSAISYAAGNSSTNLAQLFASDDLYTTPQKSASALPTFLGNHDMGRVGYFLRSTDAPLERDRLAHELMFLSRGQPVIYYGDEQGFTGAGAGNDQSARQSLFASQVPEYVDQQLITGEQAGSVDRFDPAAPLYEHIAALSDLRESIPALEDGAQIERFAEGGVYAFSRVHRDDKVEHLVATNNTGAPVTVTVPTLTPDATFSAVYGDGGGTADAGGALSVTVPALGAVVLAADRPVGAPDAAAAITVDAPKPGAGLGGLAPVAADVADSVWQETSFAWRVVGDDTWTPLGTAEDTSPRVFHDVAGLAAGTLLEYRAVSVDAAGQHAAASTYASVGNTVSLEDVSEPEPEIDMVTVPGSLNSEMGCAGDWQPGCEAAALELRADGVWAGTFDLPAGAYEYKVAINGSWAINYGAGGVRDGANIAFTTDGGPVTFYFDPRTNFAQNSEQGPIVTAVGSFQSEAGCPGDWQPDCLRTWLQDADGDGVLTWTTDALPTGAYEAKVAHGLSWDENYGAGGAPNGANIPFTVTEGKATTFRYDLATHVLQIDVADPPLPGTGQQRAHWVSASTLAWPRELLPVNADPADLRFELHSSEDASLEVVDGAVTGGEAIELEYDPAGLSEAERDRFPALAEYVALRPAGVDRAAIERLLTTQLRVAQFDGDELTAFTGVQLPGVLDDLFAEDAADRELGVTWEKKRPSVALWAPTARSVDLLVYADGDAADPTRVTLERQSDGTWTAEGEKQWRDASYLYEVVVYAPSTDAIETNLVTDPYSVGLTLNSERSVFVDLDAKEHRPKAWEKTAAPRIADPVDRSIYELHVRDFSIGDASVPEALRGTYGAFGVDSAGTRHLRTLADAGLNTVHLLPTFDIATIEEDRAAQAVPPCDLASFAPDSPEQQACIAQIREDDGFNWGYDPLHFSTPEGSYAVDARGGDRTAEFRGMVGSLHGLGLQVVLDQVFNHTAQSGQGEKSVLERVVPGYYHRLNAQGAVETSTCCQNVATEHALAEKLMVDSVVLWARDYKVDGFRFDLMGHHSKQNMLAVRAALDELTVKRDSVDGSAVYLYGEGWNFGEVADNALFEQATQGQLGGTGIGTFNDRLRDAVHGGSPVDSSTIQQQGFGTGLGTDPNGAPINGTTEEALARLAVQSDLVRIGLAGNLRAFSFVSSDGTVKRGDELDYNGSPAGYADEPEETINYVDAHDNETLFDLLALKLPADTPMAERVRMNTLSLATVTLSQAPSLWHAGTDLLRSKSLDRNSYDSGDWFNRIDWTGQSNNFGVGLPQAADNEDQWPIQAPLLADPALRPAPADIAAATAAAQDLLRLKQSTKLFRLGSADLIREKLSFPGSGPDAAPGVIAMHIDDTVGVDVDPALDGLLTVFNASPEPVSLPIDGLVGHDLALSAVQQAGADAGVKATTWDAATGTVTVPARTVAVLTEAQAPDPVGSTTTGSANRLLVKSGGAVTYSFRVQAGETVPTGTVEVLDRGRVVGTVELDGSDAGRGSVKLTLARGVHLLTARYEGSSEVLPSRTRWPSVVVAW